ncbi:MAG: DpnII family type II restriction endonuclease [Bryobacteraceae bacterium]
MEVIAQELDDILDSLGPLTVDWQDETAVRVISRLESFPVKRSYTKRDVQALLDDNFDDGILICRLFLGMSKDQFVSVLRGLRDDQGIGVKSYRADREGYIADLLSSGLLEAMADQANRKPHWSDILIERLRSGRGSAIAGQRRGRGVEDFAEEIVKRVFGLNFQVRCSFSGPRGQIAKCDFAIPSKSAARILIEAKGYGATGSKMTDILGDLHTIIARKRPDTALLFFTDGLTWKQRKSDLRKIVELQNNGDITRIYTSAMADRFEGDLRQLKREYKL